MRKIICLQNFLRNDVRPGLVQDRRRRREYNLEAKKVKISEDQQNKAKASSATHRLQEGLNNPLTPDNKGFALLAKMGYKQGEALGKSQTGIVEPVGIVIKSDRAGLGRENALKNLEQKRQEIRKRKLENMDSENEKKLEDYRKRLKVRNEEKSILRAFYSCQRVCEKLDQEQKYEYPVLKWFWPDNKEQNEEDQESDNEDEDDEEEEFEYLDKLEVINDYLRTTYRYCHWCGVRYNDEIDLESNCPGPEKDDH
ncbi:G patch domain-containing protein 11 isoform X2 [Condylostylus longicornis]|uniref:G patch domain-containing protein 11 isoform X2 n=1 Tax=Condylostylus longicornis TaxID=2530218 RepID=UPI00244E12A9|nr:G patch domain-containing protein 11 isoform X2 [Condylostylus longicornis]